MQGQRSGEVETKLEGSEVHIRGWDYFHARSDLSCAPSILKVITNRQGSIVSSVSKCRFTLAHSGRVYVKGNTPLDQPSA